MTPLAQARVAAGVSQTELAFVLGISLRAYQDLEKGMRQIKVQMLANCAIALAVDPVDLLGPDWLQWRPLTANTVTQPPDPELFIRSRRLSGATLETDPYWPLMPDFDWPLSMHLQRVMLNEKISQLTIPEAAERVIADRRERRFTGDGRADERLPEADEDIEAHLLQRVQASRILGGIRSPNTPQGRWVIACVRDNKLWNRKIDEWFVRVDDAHTSLQELAELLQFV